jgi:Protein of unknown function (DUF2971)
MEPDYTGVGIIQDALGDDEPSPGILYHYTTSRGLKGILETKCMWASHVRYLNDLTEYERGFRIAERLTSKLDLPTGIQDLLRNALDTAERKLKVFVASFSDDGGDRLSQWRGYGLSGAGVSIGMDIASIRGCRRATTPGMTVLAKRCVYDESAIDRLIADSLDSVMNLVAEIATGEPQRIANVSVSFAFAVAVRAAILKHHGFNEEKEWRLIAIELPPGKLPKGVIGFHEGRSSQIPHAEIPLTFEGKQLTVGRIVVGPSSHPKDTKRAVEMMLEKYCVQCKEVALSEIPYRNW